MHTHTHTSMHSTLTSCFYPQEVILGSEVQMKMNDSPWTYCSSSFLIFLAVLVIKLVPFASSSVPSSTPAPPSALVFTQLPLNINSHSLRSATVCCKTPLCIHFNLHSKGENSLFILMCWEHFNKDHSYNLHGVLYPFKNKKRKEKSMEEFPVITFCVCWCFFFCLGLSALYDIMLEYSILSCTGWCFVGRGVYLIINLTQQSGCFISDQLTMCYTQRLESLWLILLQNQPINICMPQRKPQNTNAHANILSRAGCFFLFCFFCFFYTKHRSKDQD